MRFVERAAMAPHKCAVFPTLGADHRKGYVDAGHVLAGWDPYVYVSVEAVEQMAELVGLPSREAHEEAVRELDQALREIRLLREQLADADEELSAIHVLKGKGYVSARKPGRPTASKAA